MLAFLKWLGFLAMLSDTAMQCPAGSGMVFQCNATSICHPTCNNPKVSTTCTRPNKAACVCPAGTLLDNGVCTSTCLGGCVDNTGAFRQVAHHFTNIAYFAGTSTCTMTFLIGPHWLIGCLIQSLPASATETEVHSSVFSGCHPSEY